MRFVVKLILRSNLMTTFENTILRELADLPEARRTDVLAYIRFLKLGLADEKGIEKRFDESWKNVRTRAKKLKITQADIAAEIRAVREAK
jgi:hypothetical protein